MSARICCNVATNRRGTLGSPLTFAGDCLPGMAQMCVISDSTITSQEDPWNAILSGACTGGLLAIRAGPKAAGKNAVIGGLVLAMIEGASIAITKVSTPVQNWMSARGRGAKNCRGGDFHAWRSPLLVSDPVHFFPLSFSRPQPRHRRWGPRHCPTLLYRPRDLGCFRVLAGVLSVEWRRAGPQTPPTRTTPPRPAQGEDLTRVAISCRRLWAVGATEEGHQCQS